MFLDSARTPEILKPTERTTSLA